MNTDNFVESFNNVLKNHYLTLRHDKSIYSLTKILLHCVFPDQEREYVVLTARQTSTYRKPRKDLPLFLQNRPAKVQNACLASMEKAKLISSTAISETSSSSGEFKVKSGNGTYDVKIMAGSCSCPYFCQERIPCKHMFSIFNHFAWNWSDLPNTLTESAYMTLEIGLLEIDQLSCQELDKDDMDDNEMEASYQHPAEEIPLYQPQGTRLLGLQKKSRDVLAKCSAAVFMVDDIDFLEQLHVKINEMYESLVQSISVNNSSGDMPIVKQLMADEILQYKRKVHLTARSNQLTRRYRVMAARKRQASSKVTSFLQKRKRLQDDPLNLATRPSIGRPKGKKKS